MRLRKIIDPNWVKEHIDLLKDELERFGRNPGDLYMYFPKEYDRRLTEKEFNWIMIAKPPYTEIIVPAFSIWLAKVVQMSRLSYKGIPAKLLEIITPKGPLRLHFEEVRIINLKDYLPFTIPKSENNGEPDLKIHFLNKDSLGKKLEDQLFYIRSKGIPMSVALQFIADNLDSPDFCYFIFHKEYQRMFCREEYFILDDVKVKE